MGKLSEVDENLKVETQLKKDDICFYDASKPPFSLHGVIAPQEAGKPFYRMPPEIADTVNRGVAAMNRCTAGGRVRFKTDSSYVAIHVDMPSELDLLDRGPHLAFTATAGMDLYEFLDGKERYVMTFIPPMNMKDHYESIIEFPDARERELTINFPLYGGFTRLLIGVSNGAKIEKGREYTHYLPVVYYGSSVTQGGCASRPGNSYQSIISRRLDCDYINLGFSGWGRGEQEMAQYISKLPMSAFVMDYDHNAPTLEHLQDTHKAFFKTVRAANPELPIIFASRPHGESLTAWRSAEDVEARFRVIKHTYDEAVANGDKNVYLIDGREMVKDIPDSWSIDLSHPTDIGFHAMAKAFGDVLKNVLNK